MTDKQIAQALRCVSNPCESPRPCQKCKYYSKAVGCEADQIGLDAADAIERLATGKARLAERLDESIAAAKMWKRRYEELARKLRLDPEKLIEADAEGHAIVLPCKVGDMAYWVHNGVITDCCVHRIQVNRKGMYLCLRSIVSHGAFRVDACLDKNVFLTREKAEKALEAMKDG